MNYFYYQPMDMVVHAVVNGDFVHLKIGKQTRVVPLIKFNKWVKLRVLIAITAELADVFNEAV